MLENTDILISMDYARKILKANNIIGIPMNVYKVLGTNNIAIVYDNALGEFKKVFDGDTGEIVEE